MDRLGPSIRRVPAGRTVHGRLRVPPSKSLTQRYLNLALLAGHTVRIARPLDAEDCRHFAGALGALGWRVAWEGSALVVEPPARPAATAEIFCGNSGTMLRLLAASLCTVPGTWILDGAERLRQRPVEPLVGALRVLGAEIDFRGRSGFAPLAIRGGSLEGGSVRLDASESSQYVSALLMAGLRAHREVVVEAEALTSAPYVELTCQAIRAAGGGVERVGERAYRVEPAPLTATSFEVEGDYSAAAYPAAAAVVTGGRVVLEGLRAGSAQGDRAFLELLVEMGARLRWGSSGVEVAAGSRLEAVEADLSKMPDQVPTLAAVAPFARGTTRIRGVPHLRLKESDRLAAMASELGRLGVGVEERPDGLVVSGEWAETEPPATSVRVRAHGDHRIAMSLAIVGLRRPGVEILDPETVDKSYPGFWTDLEGLLAA